MRTLEHVLTSSCELHGGAGDRISYCARYQYFPPHLDFSRMDATADVDAKRSPLFAQVRAARDRSCCGAPHFLRDCSEGEDRRGRVLAGASQILLRRGSDMILSDRGLGPRALRDIKAAQATGRFTITDPELALVAAGGAILALGALLHREPDRDAAKAADALTTDLLCMFGMDMVEAQEICSRPLPDLGELLS